MSHPLAEAQTMEGCPILTTEERERVSKLRFPGDYDGKKTFGGRYFAQKPAIDINEWYSDHYAKLRGLERAEGR